MTDPQVKTMCDEVSNSAEKAESKLIEDSQPVSTKMEHTSFALPTCNALAVSPSNELVLYIHERTNLSKYSSHPVKGFAELWTRPSFVGPNIEKWHGILAVENGMILLYGNKKETYVLDPEGRKVAWWAVENVTPEAASNSSVVFRQGSAICDWQLNVHDWRENHMFSLVPSDKGKWWYPHVCVGPDGRFVVGDHAKRILEAFSPEGERLYEVKTDYAPYRVASNSEHVYAIDLADKTIVRVHDTRDGEPTGVLSAEQLGLLKGESLKELWAGQGESLHIKVSGGVQSRLITHYGLRPRCAQ